jgi:glycosyltransferase involved in cell wall biosynthesis
MANLLFISTKTTWGGSEPLWSDAAERAYREGHSVSVVIPEPKKFHPRHEQLRSLGVRFLTRPPRKSLSIGNRVRRKLSGETRDWEMVWWKKSFPEKPDAICVSQGGGYCALSMPGLVPWLLECGVPYVIVCHSHRNYALPDAAYRAELRKYLVGAAKVCFVAREHIRAAARFLGVELKNATVVQNPVNLAEVEIKKNLTTIEHLGRCEKEQPKVGPKGEGVGSTESKDTERTEEGGKDLSHSGTANTEQGKSEAGLRPSSRAAAAFSNLSTIGLARDCENTLPTNSAVGPASLPATSYSLPATAPKALMACVARFEVRDKGQDLLLEALADPVWRERDFQLDFFGSGPDREILEDLISFYGLRGKVRIVGFESDIRKIWNEHHLLVLPSLSEGTPISLIEAQICGRPALVTRVDGNPDWVEEGRTGFLAEAPTVHHLRLALERAWENRHRWQEMGEAARAACLAKRDPDPAGTLLRLLKAAAEA